MPMALQQLFRGEGVLMTPEVSTVEGNVRRYLRKWPDSILTQPCRRIDLKVPGATATMRQLTSDMVHIAEATGRPSLGIAAPQVGEPLMVICLKWGEVWIALINPVVIRERGRWENIEGCLSLPDGEFYRVERPKLAKVRGTTPDGQVRSLKGHDIWAAVIDHEMDHLTGIMVNKVGRRVYP